MKDALATFEGSELGGRTRSTNLHELHLQGVVGHERYPLELYRIACGLIPLQMILEIQRTNMAISKPIPVLFQLS